MNTIIYAVIAAFIIDLVLGDPVYRAHPVRLIGGLISVLENNFRRLSKNMLLNGLFFTFTVVFISCASCLLCLFAARGISFLLGIRIFDFYPVSIIIAVFFIYSGISIKDLRDKSMEIYQLLAAGNLAGARQQVAMIVGRDTENLDEEEIIRAVVETIAENSVDGVLSPLFYALIGGAPAVAFYKAVNTLDSMVGYKNERYLYFGRASAILDDIMNFIPARISPFLIALAALLTGKNTISALKIASRDGRKNPSPNSGISEAAFAGALHIRLGGTNYYGGIPSQKPVIGDGNQKLQLVHIKQSLHILYGLSFLALLTGIAVHAVIMIVI